MLMMAVLQLIWYLAKVIYANSYLSWSEWCLLAVFKDIASHSARESCGAVPNSSAQRDCQLRGVVWYGAVPNSSAQRDCQSWSKRVAWCSVVWCRAVPTSSVPRDYK